MLLASCKEILFEAGAKEIFGLSVVNTHHPEQYAVGPAKAIL